MRDSGEAWSQHDAEVRARSLLASGDVSAALREVEHVGRPTSSVRLLRNVCLALVGRRVDAHLDLASWARHSCCPMNARLLLALIELEIGASNRAVDALRANLDQIDDPRTVRMMMMSCVESGHQGTAAQWAQKLFALSNAWLDPTAELVAQTTLVNSETMIPTDPIDAHVETLAGELIDNESVIPSLVLSAQHNDPTRSTLLLRRALACIVYELDDMCAGYEALAQLAAHAGDEKEARHWARRGLGEFPTSAPLALLLAQLPPGPVRLQVQPAFQQISRRRAGAVRIVPRPSRVEPDLKPAEQKRALDVVIRAHPDWPDVRQARLELTQPMREAA